MTLLARRQKLVRLRRHIAELEKRVLSAPHRGVIDCGPLCMSLGALHEFRAEDWRDGPAVQGLALAIAGKIAARAAKPVVWIGRRHESASSGGAYAGGLVFFGLDPDEMIFVFPRTAQETLWAAEEAARASSLAAVLIEFFNPHGALNLTATRRLQLAAEKSGATLILLRGPRNGEPSAARLRASVSAAPSAMDRYDMKASGNPRWRVRLERCRTGERGDWVLEWDSDKRELIKAPPLYGGALSTVAYRPCAEAKSVA